MSVILPQPATSPIPTAYAGIPTSYAGFWWRVLASFLDITFIYIAFIVVGFVMGIVVGLTDPSSLKKLVDEPAVLGLVFLASVFISTILIWLLCAGFESSKYQATPGKMVCRLIVTDKNGNRISFGRATGRHFAKALSNITLCIGYLMVCWTKRKQGLHDILASTLVLRRQLPPTYNLAGTVPLPKLDQKTRG
ncbi:MAG: RDD family protein [Alphaproteobacteria bacterium]|nr:MAG: RDD family protein [Alphaproteobacteria bacterium]